MPPRLYRDSDADLKHLAGKTCAILGFGSQGRAQALNLRDSGMRVVVGLRPGSTSIDRARAEGLEVLPVPEAVTAGDVVMLLLPDTRHGEVYRSEIATRLKAGQALGVAHGFSLLYEQVTPPKDVDVFLLAPKGIGPQVRRMYVDGKGVPGLLAIHQDATGRTQNVALAYAKGIGLTRAAVYETTIREETETDLFGEQVVLCGGLTALITAGFETLVAAGYSPEAAYFECLHEVKLIADLVNERGIDGMRAAISDTAKFGDITRGPRIITDQARAEMRRILEEIQSGAFAREWIQENENGRPRYEALLRQAARHPIEQVGRQVRAHFPWMTKAPPQASSPRRGHQD